MDSSKAEREVLRKTDNTSRCLHNGLAAMRVSIQELNNSKEFEEITEPAGLTRLSRIVDLFQTYFSAGIIILQEAAIIAIREELLFFCDDIAGVHGLCIDSTDLQALRSALLVPLAFLDQDKLTKCDEWMNDIYHHLEIVESGLNNWTEVGIPLRQLRADLVGMHSHFSPVNTGNGGGDDSKGEPSCIEEI